MKPRSMTALILALAALPVLGQQFSTTSLGTLTTNNKLPLSVTVDSTGTLILSTHAKSVYLDRPYAAAFADALDAILAGMKDLEGKGLSVRDYRALGKLSPDGSLDANADGIVFRLELNAASDRKVLLDLYSTRAGEDLLLGTDAVAQLDDLVKKGLRSSSDYGDQYAFIESTVSKIQSAVFLR